MLKEEAIAKLKELEDKYEKAISKVGDDLRFYNTARGLKEMLQGEGELVLVPINRSEINRPDSPINLSDRIRFVRKTCGTNEQFSWKDWISYWQWMLDPRLDTYQLVVEPNWEPIINVLRNYEDFSFEMVGGFAVVTLKK